MVSLLSPYHEPSAPQSTLPLDCQGPIVCQNPGHLLAYAPSFSLRRLFLTSGTVRSHICRGAPLVGIAFSSAGCLRACGPAPSGRLLPLSASLSAQWCLSDFHPLLRYSCWAQILSLLLLSPLSLWNVRPHRLPGSGASAPVRLIVVPPLIVSDHWHCTISHLPWFSNRWEHLFSAGCLRA